MRLVQFDSASLHKQRIDTSEARILCAYIKHISQLSRDIFACARGNASYVIVASNLHRYFSSCTVSREWWLYMGRVWLKQSHKTGPCSIGGPV